MKITGVPTGVELEGGRHLQRVPSPSEPERKAADPVPVQKAQAPSPESGDGSGRASDSTSKVMERIAEEVQRFIRENSVKLDMSFDEDLKMIITKVMNEETGEVIRQYPPEEMVSAMKQLRGVLVNRKG